MPRSVHGAAVRKAFKVKSVVGRLPSPKSILVKSGKTPAAVKQQAKKAGVPAKSVGVHGFPGQIKNSQIGSGSVAHPNPYPDGTTGRFVQSVKGMKGKQYVNKALEATLAMYAGD